MCSALIYYWLFTIYRTQYLIYFIILFCKNTIENNRKHTHIKFRLGILPLELSVKNLSIKYFYCISDETLSGNK